jgi:hypothetical protein
MRRAHQKRTASRHAIAEPAAGQVNGSIASSRDFGRSSTSIVEPPVAEILLSSSGTFANDAVAESDGRCEQRRQLAIAIRQRIESRLPGRVRNLVVHVLSDTVLLEGQCATYYTKQLAQHTALGILEDEHLENAIEVCVPR